MPPKLEKQLLDEGLQCSICIEFFNAPLTLQCSHSFCRLCLLQSTRLAPDGRSCPECRAPIQIKDPLREPADALLEAKVRDIVPADVVEARKSSDLSKLAEFQVEQSGKLPIFSMKGAASRPGESVALHFFEPRYKILIRRAWEGNRNFLCTQRPPREGDTGLLVTVSSASFLADGRANIQGSGVQCVTLGRVWAEEGTGGLNYAEVPQGVADKAIPASGQQQRGSSRGGEISSASSSEAEQEQRRPSRRQEMPSEITPSQIRNAITNAIQSGAPAYNRGQVDVCAQTYAKVARELLERHLSRAVASRLQAALDESSAAGRDWDRAAWALRHAFDDILDNRVDMTADIGSSHHELAVEEEELPVFFMDQRSTASVGRTIRLNWFEPRYKVLAREVWSSESRMFLHAVAKVETGASAMLMKLTDCSFDEGGRASISGVSVAVVQFGSVRMDELKGDLYYAKCAVPQRRSTTSRTASGKSDQPKGCCTVQ